MNWLDLPAEVAIPGGIVLLDLVLYCQHRAFHTVPLLWRLHRVHHSSPDYDLTTGLRFHPGEAVVFNGVNIACIVAIGPPVAAVILFEIVTAATTTFTHGKIRLSPARDRALRRVVVTPEMHRVHHSAVIAETNSNFGSIFPFWDRALGTYRHQPAAGHDAMEIGLEEFRDPAQLTLRRTLLMPFERQRRATQVVVPP